MAIKLTRDQKRSKQKKKKAQDAQQRFDKQNKVRRLVSQMHDMIMDTTYNGGAIDAVEFAAVVNKTVLNPTKENPDIQAFRASPAGMDIQKFTSLNVEAIENAIADGFEATPLAGRLFEIYDDEDPGVISYPWFLCFLGEVSFSTVAAKHMESIKSEAIATVYFVGLTLVEGIVHVAAIADNKGNLDCYIVYSKGWIRIANPSHASVIDDLARASQEGIRHPHFQGVESALHVLRNNKQLDLSDLENLFEFVSTPARRNVVSLIGSDLMAEMEWLSEAAHIKAQRDLQRAKEEAEALGLKEIHKRDREIDQLQTRNSALERRLATFLARENSAVKVSPTPLDRPLTQRMADIFC